MKISLKPVTLEKRIRIQIEQAIIKWAGEKIDVENAKRKPKVYYRRGRWE